MNPVRNKRRPSTRITGWVLGVFSTLVYVLCLEPTVSFWDCGEFIATSYGLQVGHPPGAPFYQLLAHAFTWLACGNVRYVAYCCNLLSAVAGGATVMLLFWSLCLMAKEDSAADDTQPQKTTWAVVGALCYLFCHTAWFSAVESEVYSTAMLLCAAIVWSALRWLRCDDRRHAPRWLLLASLLTGLGVCVHLMVLLTLPAIAAIAVVKMHNKGSTITLKQHVRIIPLLCLFFIIGLTPYLIIPIRAHANPPINMGQIDSAEDFKNYVSRKQYEHAPLWPRRWRNHPNDDSNAAAWADGDGWQGELRYYASYQLGFMYGRYLCDNFVARHNQHRGHAVWYMLPLLLALAGIYAQLQERRGMFCATLLLFLFGGPVLNFYLNHPCYEPRERDYAYVLSFYAVCLWIGEGARWVQRQSTATSRLVATAVLYSAPLLMAWGNWDDHDRSHRYVARDAATNLLNSCDPGSVLFTFGDNDTFPLWYLQQVEKERCDVTVYNINLIGYQRFWKTADTNIDHRPCYLSQYAYDQLSAYFPDHLSLEGICYRLHAYPTAPIDTAAFRRHLQNGLGWHDTTGVFIDPVGRSFITQYENCMKQYRECVEEQAH